MKQRWIGGVLQLALLAPIWVIAPAQAAEGLQSVSPVPRSHAHDGDNALQARYAAALRAAILRQWVRPPAVIEGATCRVLIEQSPGGQVVKAHVDSSACPLDELGRQSVIRAIFRAEPLPYQGFERVFNRSLALTFAATGD